MKSKEFEVAKEEPSKLQLEELTDVCFSEPS